MITARTLTCVISLIAVVIWRNGTVARNCILRTHEFPAGYFASGNFNSSCTTLKTPDLKYCEDMTFWNHLGHNGNLVDRFLLISCDGNRKEWNTVMGPLRDPAPHGTLWIYHPDTLVGSSHQVPEASKLQRLRLKGFPPGHDFHPLGLEAYPSYAGNASNLYVVNHARDRTVIEHFTLLPSKPDVVTHVRTLVSSHFLSANSIALTSPHSFYVTNDHLITRRLPYVGHILPLIESLLALPLSFVSHIVLSPVDIESELAIESKKYSLLFMPFPNGISLSPDGLYVSIASTTLGSVLIYSRNRSDHALKLVSTIPLPFLPDNVQYTHDGSAVIVAGHPHFPTIAKVASKKSNTAPSWVASITLADVGLPVVKKFDAQAPIPAHNIVPTTPGYDIETLLQSNGSGFSSSSTGLKDPFTGALYVSGLYAEEGVLICGNSHGFD